MEKIWDEAFLRKVDKEIEQVRRKLEEDKELRRLVSRYRTLGTVLTREMLKKGLHPDMKIKKSKEYMELEEMLDSEFNKGNKNPRWDNVYMYTDCGIFWFYNIGCEVGNKSVCIDQVTPSPISGSDKCDIHYEPLFWLLYEGKWVEGLVNMAGCNPAENCDGTCGRVNSKRRGTCMVEPAWYPELYQVSALVWAYYGKTYDDNGNPLGGCWNVHTPPNSSCTIDLRGQYSQYMIFDYYP